MDGLSERLLEELPRVLRRLEAAVSLQESLAERLQRAAAGDCLPASLAPPSTSACTPRGVSPSVRQQRPTTTSVAAPPTSSSTTGADGHVPEEAAQRGAGDRALVTRPTVHFEEEEPGPRAVGGAEVEAAEPATRAEARALGSDFDLSAPMVLPLATGSADLMFPTSASPASRGSDKRHASGVSRLGSRGQGRASWVYESLKRARRQWKGVGRGLTSRRTAGSSQPESATNEVAEVYRSYTYHQEQRAIAARGYEMHLREQMKGEVKKAAEMCRTESMLTSLRRLQDRMQSAVSSRPFEALFCAIIVANVAVIGAEVEHSADTSTDDPAPMFLSLSQAFNIAFIVEFILRIIGQGPCTFCSSEHKWWNALDAALVLTSVVELYVEQLRVRFLTMLRMVRAVRLFRLIRIVRFFRSLRLLVYSIANTMKTLVWTMVLLFVILYLFGVLFTQAAIEFMVNNELDDDQLNGPRGLRTLYGTVTRSVFTLFLSITGGIAWGEAVEPLFYVHPAWVGVFATYFFVTYFAVLNVVTGVFCQMAIESASQDAMAVMQAQQAAKAEYVRSLTNLFGIIDSGKMGKITVGAFEDSLQSDDVQAFFASIDLTVDDAWELFKLLDHDEENMINIEEFVTGCLQLRGGARSVDIALLRYEVKWMMKGVTRFMTATAKQLQYVTAAYLPAQSQGLPVAGRHRTETNDARFAFSEALSNYQASTALGGGDIGCESGQVGGQFYDSQSFAEHRHSVLRL